jgi:hypothetical protein
MFWHCWEDCIFTIFSFIMWMPHGAHNVFALLIIFLGNDWKVKNYYWIV